MVFDHHPIQIKLQIREKARCDMLHIVKVSHWPWVHRVDSNPKDYCDQEGINCSYLVQYGAPFPKQHRWGWITRHARPFNIKKPVCATNKHAETTPDIPAPICIVSIPAEPPIFSRIPIVKLRARKQKEARKARRSQKFCTTSLICP